MLHKKIEDRVEVKKFSGRNKPTNSCKYCRGMSQDYDVVNEPKDVDTTKKIDKKPAKSKFCSIL